MLNRILKSLIAAAVILSVALLIFSSSNQNASKRSHLPLEKIGIIGSYSFEQSEATQELTAESMLDEDGHDSLYITGHLSRPVPINRLIMLRVDNIKAEIFLNGSLLYTYIDDAGYRFYDKAGGNLWTYFVSPGISTADTVEIYLQNPYGHQGIHPFRELIDTIYTGYDIELFQSILAGNAPRLFSAVMVVCIGLILLIACIILFFMKDKHTERYFYLAGFAITSGIWFFIRFDIMSFFSPFPMFNNLLDAVTLSLIALFYLAYQLCFITGKSRWVLLVIEYVYTALCIGYFIAILLGYYDPYTNRSIHIMLIGIASGLTIACVIYEVICNKDSEARSILLSVIMLCGGCIADAINYYVFHIPINIIFNICFIIFILLEIVKMIRFYISATRKAELAAHLETELLESKVALMLSQIQPHFLYNALTSIRQLCREDPNRAEQAVIDFSNFLRGNMDSLSTTKPIPFDRELVHLKRYLAIEKLRFEDKLEIIYDVKTTGFMIPALSIQPIVENAIRHGVMKKVSGGTIKIATEETDDTFILSVTDDGVGFDTENQYDDGLLHHGIANVRNRLKSICNGNLEVRSTPGEGTVTIITLPKSN